MAKMDEKREIRETIKGVNVDTWTFQGGINDTITELIAARDAGEELGYFAICITDDGWGSDTNFIVKGTRLETDKERDKRVDAYRKERAEKKAEKKIKEQAVEDGERKIYLKLHQKFGGK